MTATTAHEPSRARLRVLLLAALAVLIAVLFPAVAASADTLPAAQTGVGVSHPAATGSVGLDQRITAGRRRDGPRSQLQIVSGHCVAAEGADDTVSLFKASQRGLGESHYTDGYKPEDFPGNGAYFAREKGIADSYATHYGEGVIETRVPRDIYDEHFAQYEMKYLGSPPGTELAIPSDMLGLLSQFERIWH